MYKCSGQTSYLVWILQPQTSEVLLEDHSALQLCSSQATTTTTSKLEHFTNAEIFHQDSALGEIRNYQGKKKKKEKKATSHHSQM